MYSILSRRSPSTNEIVGSLTLTSILTSSYLVTERFFMPEVSVLVEKTVSTSLATKLITSFSVTRFPGDISLSRLWTKRKCRRTSNFDRGRPEN